MADTAARLALYARRYEVARFTIAVRGIDLRGVAMAMQVRLQRGTPGAPLIALGTVTTTAAEGLKLDSVTIVDGLPVSIIKGRINQSTMSDGSKVPYAGEMGDDTVLAYAMQWTLAGDVRTRIEGDLIVRDSAFGSDNAPANRPAGYGSQSIASSGTGTLTFGDQVVQVSIADAELFGPLVEKTEAAADKATAAAVIVGDVVVRLIVPGVSGGFIDAAGRIGGAVDDDGRFISDMPEPPVQPARPLPPVAAGVSTLAMVPVLGQSNSFQWATASLDQSPLDPGRALGFGAGYPHLGVTYPPMAYLADSDLGQMTDLRGAPFERGGIGMRLAHRMLVDGLAVLVTGHGVGGQPYSALKKGTIPFANATRAMMAARDQAFDAGLGFTIPLAVWVQGEDNFGDSKAAYLAHLVELQADIERQARAVTGSTDIVPLYMAQPSSWTGYGAKAATSGMPLAVVQAAINAPDRFVPTTPFYPFKHVDEAHLDAEGNCSLDDLIGWCAAHGSGGLYAVSAARAGTTVTVTCHRPVGSTLAIKTDRVSDPGSYGLVYRDANGAKVAISNVAVAGDKITLTLASAVAGTLSFAAEGTPGQPAGPTTGPRCCICAVTGDTLPGGAPLNFYMLTCSVEVA
ncbi:hypothetical protein [uncultured Sphingomonas sp.]|uniref:hypothetical protein n=1 Tax=uncultured Sphingomonas sp. TaxID=158754 RepID=UPI00263763F7|nr:hypothetical protein [uncultured Sphingomonas sp.]